MVGGIKDLNAVATDTGYSLDNTSFIRKHFVTDFLSPTFKGTLCHALDFYGGIVLIDDAVYQGTVSI